MNRRFAGLCAGLLLVLVPGLALAEVSVQLDQRGHVRHTLYLTRGPGGSRVVWGQVRDRLPLEVLLNPLGDNLGDLPPAIAINPRTHAPWVVWPQNVGNQKRLAFSAWDGKGWTAPVQIVRPDLMGSDQVEPKLLFDVAGTPYLVFTEESRPARVLFVTLSNGAWTPPILLSDRAVDSRHPMAAVRGSDLLLNYDTPTGSIDRVLPTGTLVKEAASLMDSPIPPGALPTKPKDPSSPGGGEEPGDPFIIHR
jgi:hypothetical protein